MNIIILLAIFIIYTYIAIKDWKTGLISILLNFSIFGLAVLYAFLNHADIFDIMIKFLIFVLPFIIVEFIFQVFFNKEKDDDKFLIGGGDIILFASMSLILDTLGMMVMFFFASLASLIIAKIVKERRIPFAPFLEFGFLIAILFTDKIYGALINLAMFIV